MHLNLQWIRNRETFVARLSQSILGVFSKFYVFDVLIIVICAASFGFSLIESLVNNDNIHWGWAYIASLDIKRGAIPHSEIIIFYGFIYTWIQSVALGLFGERLISLGIITGLFYSLTLFLSYLVFLKFLKKSLAFISVLLIFLIHPYIIYPFPNYFAYTFQLLALVFFLRYVQSRYYGFGAGFFLCMAVLCRYSSSVAILPPFAALLLWDFMICKDFRRSVIKKIAIIGLGFFVPCIAFFTYLFVNSALDDFFYQNNMIIKTIGDGYSIKTYLNFIASIFQIVPSYASDFRGKIFTVILGVGLFIILREGVRKLLHRNIESPYNNYTVMAVCVVTIFGYLNSIHVYETFRLVNGASLGVGLCALVFYNVFVKVGKPLKYLMLFICALLIFYLSSTILFKQTTSSYYPWKKDVLLHNGVQNQTIGIFKGKILTKEYNDFYQEVFDTIKPFKNHLYILNYSDDCVAFILNDLPRVQTAPIHFPWLDDISKQAKLVEGGKSVILSYKKLDFPGYAVIFAKKTPEEIPWLGGGYLFISVPKQYVKKESL